MITPPPSPKLVDCQLPLRDKNNYKPPHTRTDFAPKTSTRPSPKTKQSSSPASIETTSIAKIKPPKKIIPPPKIITPHTARSSSSRKNLVKINPPLSPEQEKEKAEFLKRHREYEEEKKKKVLLQFKQCQSYLYILQQICSNPTASLFSVKTDNYKSFFKLNTQQLQDIFTKITTELSEIPSINLKTISSDIKILLLLHHFCKYHKLPNLKNHVDILLIKFLQNWNKDSTANESMTSSKNESPTKYTNSNNSTIHYITDSDDDLPHNSPQNLPPNITPIINQTYHNNSDHSSNQSYRHSPPPSPSSDLFNRDYQCQYDQEFINGMEQQLHMTPYNEDDLHLAYGQGRHEKYD